MGLFKDGVDALIDAVGVLWETVKNGFIKVKNAISRFFSNFRNWILKTGEKVKQMIQGKLLGVRIYIKKFAEGIIRKMTSHFSKNGDVLEETVVTKKIPESEVPPEFVELANYNESTDLTDDFKKELVLA